LKIYLILHPYGPTILHFNNLASCWTIAEKDSNSWLDVLSLPEPKHLVTAESVTEGKPAPDCYILGLENLNLHDSKGSVVVLEDSPAGIRAGKEAGCKVCAVVTSHTIDQIISAKPDWIVQDLSSLRVRDDGPGVDPSNRSALKTTLEIHNGLVY
jgi:glycerol 3-phosphatase-1